MILREYNGEIYVFMVKNNAKNIPHIGKFADGNYLIAS